jgi:hypothetical protein
MLEATGTVGLVGPYMEAITSVVMAMVMDTTVDTINTVDTITTLQIRTNIPMFI